MLVLDIILVLLLISMTIAGYKKGVLGALCSLLILIIACFGAFVVMQTMSVRVANSIKPQLQQVLQERISGRIQDQTREYLDDAEERTFSFGGIEYSLGDFLSLLKTMGIDVEEKVTNGVGEASGGLVEVYAAQIAQEIASTLADILVFCAAFLILYLILHSLEMIFSIGDNLPIIKWVNHSGGAIVGFLSASVLLVFLTTLLVQSGIMPDSVTGGPVFQTLKQISSVLL